MKIKELIASYGEKMKIRKALKKDIEKLWEFEKENRLYDRKILGKKFKNFFLWDTTFKEKRKWMNTMKKILSKKNYVILVMEERNVLIGYSLGVIYNFQNPKKIGHIEEFFITKKYRSKGFSSILIKEIIKWFKSRGINYVSLDVFAKNKDVIKIYERFGFEPFSIHMKKKLI